MRKKCNLRCCTNTLPRELKNLICSVAQMQLIMKEEIQLVLVHKIHLSVIEEIKFVLVTNTLEHEWRNTICAGYKYTWVWVKIYNLCWLQIHLSTSEEIQFALVWSQREWEGVEGEWQERDPGSNPSLAQSSYRNHHGFVIKLLSWQFSEP